MKAGKQIRALRDYFKLTETQLGDILGLSKKQISAIENDHRGITSESIDKLIREFNLDARYFFAQLESVEEADLSKRGEDAKVSKLEHLANQIKELTVKVEPSKGLDPVTDRVRINADLHEINEMIYTQPGNVLKEIKGAINMYLMLHPLEDSIALEFQEHRENSDQVATGRADVGTDGSGGILESEDANPGDSKNHHT